MTTQVEVRKEYVPISPDEARSRLAAVFAILRKYQNFLLKPPDSPLTPGSFPATIEEKQEGGIVR